MDNKKVIIKWVDAKIYPGMHSKDEALKRRMNIFETVGYLIKKDNQTTKIAHEIADDDTYRDILLIPSGSIISIQELTILSV